MILDFLHRSLIDLSEKDKSAIENIGAGIGDGINTGIAAPQSSSLTLKNFLAQTNKQCVFEPLFSYGRLNENALEKVAGKTLIVETVEFDTFFINDISKLTEFAKLPRKNVVIVRQTAIEGDPALKEKAVEFFMENQIKPYLSVENTLPNSLLIRMPNIKARMLKNALMIDGVFITNGENCSLSIGTPSPIVEGYGFSESEAREAISLSWESGVDPNKFLRALKQMLFRYKQILSVAQEG